MGCLHTGSADSSVSIMMKSSLRSVSRWPRHPRGHRSDLAPQTRGFKRLYCDWCRDTGMRPLFTPGTRFHTITGVEPCRHPTARRVNGQAPAGPGDVFVCLARANTATDPADCDTCQGWIAL